MNNLDKLNKLFVALLLIAVAGCNTKVKEEIKVTVIDPPSGSPSAEPFLFTDQDGTTYLSWVENREEKSEFRFSKFDGEKWLPATLIDSGRNWFVNWADYPMMAANKTKLVAHYLEKNGDGGYAYDVKFTSSVTAEPHGPGRRFFTTMASKLSMDLCHFFHMIETFLLPGSTDGTR